MKRLAISGIAMWVILVGVGIRAIVSYSTTPGAVAATPATWPSGSRISPAVLGPTVVLFAHPKCPCTRATLAELATIARSAPPFARITVVYETYDDDDRNARADIPSVTTVLDGDGSEAARFGARTSGHVVVYDAGRRLQFAGGITTSRGHVGDNAGTRTVLALVRGEQPAQHDHAVFGCALQGGS